eukprot:3314711-Lingulodinium_polyedra.AAC.1
MHHAAAHPRSQTCLENEARDDVGRGHRLTRLERDVAGPQDAAARDAQNAARAAGPQRSLVVEKAIRREQRTEVLAGRVDAKRAAALQRQAGTLMHQRVATRLRRGRASPNRDCLCFCRGQN